MKNTTSRITPEQASEVMAQVMPNVLRGVQLDFFVKRGVTQSQFLLMMAIHSYGRCTMGTLAHNLHVRMPTATGAVDRLVKAGYVRRHPDPTDRRQVVVELTTKAKEFIRDFQVVCRRRWEEVLAPLEPDELEAFHDIFLKIGERLRIA